MAEDTNKDNNKKDSFTFSDKIDKDTKNVKNTKPAPVPFTKRFSGSRVGSDGKPKQTFFERTKRDAPFFIAALIILLLLPFFIKFTGTGADDSDIVVRNPYDVVSDGGAAYDQCLDENGQIIDGCVAGAAGTDSIDLLKNALAQGTVPAEAATSLAYTPSNPIIPTEDRSAYTSVRETAPANIGAALGRVARTPTQIGNLTPGQMATTGGRLNPGWGPLAASAMQTGPTGPARPTKPITLQPLQGIVGRSTTGEAGLAEMNRSAGAMAKGASLPALMEAQIGNPRIGSGGGIGNMTRGGGGPGGSGLNNKWAFQGQKPWWWDMMAERAQAKWMFWFHLWSDALKKLVEDFGMKFVCCIIAGDSGCDPKHFFGQGAQAASEGTCGGPGSKYPKTSVQKGLPTKSSCCYALIGASDSGGKDKTTANSPYDDCMKFSDADLNFSEPKTASGPIGFWRQRFGECMGKHGGVAAGFDASKSTCTPQSFYAYFQPSGDAENWFIYQYVVARGYIVVPRADGSTEQKLLCGKTSSARYSTDWVTGAGNDGKTASSTVRQKKQRIVPADTPIPVQKDQYNAANASTASSEAAKQCNDAKTAWVAALDAYAEKGIAATETVNKAQQSGNAASGGAKGPHEAQVSGIDFELQHYSTLYTLSCSGDAIKNAVCKEYMKIITNLKTARDAKVEEATDKNITERRTDEANALKANTPAPRQYTGGLPINKFFNATLDTAKAVGDNCNCPGGIADWEACIPKTKADADTALPEDCVIYVRGGGDDSRRQQGRMFNVDDMRNELADKVLPCLFECNPGNGIDQVQCGGNTTVSRNANYPSCYDKVLPLIFVKNIYPLAMKKAMTSDDERLPEPMPMRYAEFRDMFILQQGNHYSTIALADNKDTHTVTNATRRNVVEVSDGEICKINDYLGSAPSYCKDGKDIYTLVGSQRGGIVAPADVPLRISTRMRFDPSKVPDCPPVVIPRTGMSVIADVKATEGGRAPLPFSSSGLVYQDGEDYIAVAANVNDRYTITSWSASGPSGVDCNKKADPIVAITSCCKEKDTNKVWLYVVAGTAMKDENNTANRYDITNSLTEDQKACACGTKNIGTCGVPKPDTKCSYGCSDTYRNSAFQQVLNNPGLVSDFSDCSKCYKLVTDYARTQPGMANITAAALDNTKVPFSYFLEAVCSTGKQSLNGELVCEFAQQAMSRFHGHAMDHPVRGFARFISEDMVKKLGYTIKNSDDFFPLAALEKAQVSNMDDLRTCNYWDTISGKRVCTSFTLNCGKFKDWNVTVDDFREYINAFCAGDTCDINKSGWYSSVRSSGATKHCAEVVAADPNKEEPSKASSKSSSK